MGDSDEEYDRRRGRDKFRRERSDYQQRRGEDRSRSGDDWGDRESWGSRDRGGGRRDYRDFDSRGRRDRYSPPHEMNQPMKRMRRDCGAGMGVPSGNWNSNAPSDMMGMHHQSGYNAYQQQSRDTDSGPTQPPMMTFKQFLAAQDDGIDDQEAVKKYNEYKQEFKRQQLNDFFVNHKEEEWPSYLNSCIMGLSRFLLLVRVTAHNAVVRL